MTTQRTVPSLSSAHLQARPALGAILVLAAAMLTTQGCDVARDDSGRDAFALDDLEPTGDVEVARAEQEPDQEQADADEPAAAPSALTPSQQPTRAVDNCTYVRTNTSSTATLNASCLIGEAQFHPISCGCSTDDTNAVFLGIVPRESNGTAVDNGDSFADGTQCQCRWDDAPASGNHYAFALCCTDF